MAYTTQHGGAILAVLAVALLLAMTTRAAVAAATSTGGCDGDKFPAGKSYAHCAALPHLGARLHWTYDAKAGALSVAFVAKPPAGAAGGGGGWVSWAINPTGTGMKGAQALLAFKGASTYAVNTYNLTGYAPLGAASTAIAYKATDVAADESGGEVRVFAKLQLGPGLTKVNHIWQVGSTVANGVPAKHAFETDNTEAKGTLVLSGATEAAPSPAPAGAGGASPAKGGSGGAAAPSGGKSAAVAASTFVSAPALALLALAGFLLAM